MTEVLRDPRLYEYTGGEPPTLEQLRRQYATQARGGSADGTKRWINAIIEVDARPVGYVQATVPANGEPTEIAWVVGQPWQGRGYAKAAAQQLCQQLERDGIATVVAHIHPHHVASQRIAEALGLHPTDTVVDGEVRWIGDLASRHGREPGV